MTARPSPARSRASHARASRARAPLALSAALALCAGPLAAQARPRPGAIGGAGAPTREPARPADGRAGAAQGAQGDGERTPQRGAAAAAAAVAAPAAGRPMAVTGAVYDSLADAPLAGATVQFVSETDRSRAYTTETDSLGHYRLNGITPGRYLAGFLHPDVDAIGLELRPVLIQLAQDSVAQFDFGVPGSKELLPALCGPNNPAGRGPSGANDEAIAMLLQPKPPGALTGSVRDADTGAPIPGAKVVVTWKEVKSQGGALVNASRRVPAMVRADGGFVACGLPADVDLLASAEARGRHAGMVDVRLTSGRLSRRDFVLGDTATAAVVTLPDTAAVREGRLAVPITVARGRARLTGVVRTPDGRPMAGATVVVHGTNVTGTTSANGVFTLSGLPAGTYSAEVRAIGYAPKRVAVNLSATRVASVTIPLDQRVQQIQGVVVQAERTKLQKDYTGFLDRVKHGQGHYITEEQLATRQALQFTDVLRMTPGMHVVPNGSMGYAIQGRGNCSPDIYVDGMPIIDGATSINDLVNPNDVSGVEVYNGGGTTPVQFSGASGGGSCGTVVVWSKRGRPSSTAASGAAR